MNAQNTSVLMAEDASALAVLTSQFVAQALRDLQAVGSASRPVDTASSGRLRVSALVDEATLNALLPRGSLSDDQRERLLGVELVVLFKATEASQARSGGPYGYTIDTLHVASNANG